MTGEPVVFQKKGVEGICILPDSPVYFKQRNKKISANLLHVTVLVLWVSRVDIQGHLMLQIFPVTILCLPGKALLFAAGWAAGTCQALRSPPAHVS